MTDKKTTAETELQNLRSAVHALLDYATEAPKKVEDKVRKLLYGRK